MLLGSLRQQLRAGAAGRTSRARSQVLILLRFFSVRDFSEQRPIQLRPGGKKKVEREKLLPKVKMEARGCHKPSTPSNGKASCN